MSGTSRNGHGVTASLTALRTLHTLQTASATPDEQQRAALARWAGWGPLAPALSLNPADGWEKVADQLNDLFDHHPDWATHATAATDTSFYTPAWLVDAMAEILRSVGYTGGTILEPGCGSGRFMAADLPDTTWTGVETDVVSARIAQFLHPDANVIIDPLQNVALREQSYDAVLANVPFSRHAPYDPQTPAGSLHQYFLLRALKALRPGGYLIALTSRMLFDSPQVDGLLDLADLHAVVRLASGTFPGTSAVADLLVMQRRDHGTMPAGWQDVRERTVRSDSYHRRATLKRLTITHPDKRWASVEVNTYFETYPRHVAGTMIATGYDPAPLRVASADPRTDAIAAIKAATTGLPALPAPPEVTAIDLDDVTLTDDEGRKEGSFHLDGDQVIRITGGRPEIVARPSKELRRLIELRDIVTDLIATDATHAHLAADNPDHAPGLRARALNTYQQYVTDFGYIGRGQLTEGKIDPETGEPKWMWRRPTMGGFRKDPDWMTVAACEVYDPDTQTGSPAAMLTRPVNRAPKPIERAENPAQALAVSLGETGRVDLDRIAGLLNLDPTQAREALGTLVYTDPDTGALIPAAEYLSGNVRAKLGTALAASATRPELDVNARDLAAVVPDDYGPLQIRASLGASWIGAAVVSDFTREVLGQSATITYTPGVGVWEVNSTWYTRGDAAVLYGTSERDPFQLLEAALNARTVVIYDEVYDPTNNRWKKVRNNAATLAAASKIDALQERFSVWVWEDKDRADLLVRTFNDRFRSHVPRRYDGSTTLMPTMAAGVTMWPWQKAVIERIVTSERTMCNHPVGRGKTLSMLGAAVTLRRLGLATKPLIAVPGHLLEQIATEAAQTFPAASFLVATKEDLAKDARRLFAARCATGEWDAVIMTHEALGSLPVDPHLEEDWILQQKLDLADAIRSDETRSSRGRGAKAVASAMKRLDARLAALRDGMGRDDLVTFEQLGVDFLAVDEVHYFRRLAIDSRTQGFSFGSSKRATDLLLKVHSLETRRAGKPFFAGFTGTPWSNTLAETYVWQRFFQPDRLTDAGIHTFDEWASMFVRFVTAVEVAPDGSGFRLHTRPSEVTNARVLMDMFAEVADFIDPSDEFHLPVPDGTWHTRVVQATGRQALYVTSLVERADKIRSGGQGDDNMLSVCGDGRRVALDPRLVGIEERSPKVADAAEQIARLHHQYADVTLPGASTPGILQLVVCDQGTPGASGAQTYGRIKAELVARGIEASRVRFVHEATTDKARAALFAACRDGSVNILLGSTPKVGVGTNVQARLRALHHIDAPWRPSDVEQREGRILRPGNLNTAVDIYRYVTEGTFDAYMWQTLETKARFISQLMRATVTDDTIADLGDQVLSFGEVKALAAGNPLLLEQAKVAVEVRRLRTLEAMHTQQVGAMRRQAREGELHAERLRHQAEAMTQVKDAWTEQAPSYDPGDLQRAAAGAAKSLATYAKKPGGYGVPLHRYGPLQLRHVDDSRKHVTVEIIHHYRTVTELTLPRKSLRTGGGTYLAQCLRDWLAGVEEQVPRVRQRAARLVEQAQATRRAADQIAFSKADELEAAVRLLEEINTEINASATEAPATAAA